MNCIEVGELMHRKLDSDLSTEEEKELELHLAQCASCNLIFERLSLLSTHLEQLPQVTPPFSIVDSILPRLEVAEKPLIKKDEEAVTALQKSNKKIYKKGWFISTASIAVAAAAVLFTVNLSQNTSENDNAMQLAVSMNDMANQDVSTVYTNEKSRMMELEYEDVLVDVKDQYGDVFTIPESAETSHPTGYQVGQLKVTVKSESIIDNSTNNNDTDELDMLTIGPNNTSGSNVRDGSFKASNQEQEQDLEMPEQMMTGLNVEENNLVYNSPDNKVYVSIDAHNIEIHDFNTSELLKTLEVPIEGEISFVGWHESGVEFYIDVLDANMQTHRITYTLGL